MSEETTEEHPGRADDPSADDERAEAERALHDARERLADIPAEVVVVNHVLGLYELAAIHLSADEPDLTAAGLAIDAMAALVEGLGDRLGPDTETMREALAAIRMAFVAVSRVTPPGDGNRPPR